MQRRYPVAGLVVIMFVFLYCDQLFQICAATCQQSAYELWGKMCDANKFGCCLNFCGPRVAVLPDCAVRFIPFTISRLQEVYSKIKAFL